MALFQLGALIRVLKPVFGFIKDRFGEYQNLRKVKQDGRIEIERARAKGEALLHLKRAENIGEWEGIQAKNSSSSWKDEFWTILIAIPIPLAFIPETREFVYEGFKALDQAPEWYLWAIGASVSASFGIRMGIFDKLIPGKGSKNV